MIFFSLLFSVQQLQKEAERKEGEEDTEEKEEVVVREEENPEKHWWIELEEEDHCLLLKDRVHSQERMGEKGGMRGRVATGEGKGEEVGVRGERVEEGEKEKEGKGEERGESKTPQKNRECTERAKASDTIWNSLYSIYTPPSSTHPPSSPPAREHVEKEASRHVSFQEAEAPPPPSGCCVFSCCCVVVLCLFFSFVRRKERMHRESSWKGHPCVGSRSSFLATENPFAKYEKISERFFSALFFHFLMLQRCDHVIEYGVCWCFVVLYHSKT